MQERFPKESDAKKVCCTLSCDNVIEFDMRFWGKFIKNRNVLSAYSNAYGLKWLDLLLLNNKALQQFY